MRVCMDEAREILETQGVVKEMTNDSEADRKDIITEIQLLLKQ